jgi:hypothetical protein
MPGKKQFDSAIGKIGSAVTRRLVEGDEAATSSWMERVLLGGDDQRNRSKPRSLRRDDHFIVHLMRAYAEVDSSSDTLQVILTLAQWTPPRKSAVSPEARLRFFVEAYLGEVYILSLRCDALLTFIERAYRKDSRAKQVSSACGTLRAQMKASFKTMLAARGAHVHEVRHDDFDVSRLGTLKLIASTDPLIANVHRKAIREVSRKKRQWMRDNNRKVTELLDRFFGVAYPLVFADDGSPKYPAPTSAGKRIG